MPYALEAMFFFTLFFHGDTVIYSSILLLFFFSSSTLLDNYPFGFGADYCGRTAYVASAMQNPNLGTLSGHAN